MKQKEFEIFLIAFFSDKRKIDELNVSENVPGITFKISNPNTFTETKIFQFSVLDILQMNLDCWHSLMDKDELKTEKRISPKTFYQNTLNCIKTIRTRFPEIHYDGVEYEKYINLITCYDRDENWFDDAEIKEYETEGYRRIDLDLINYGVRRNVKKVIELLDKGANPMIDPDDKSAESEILEVLGSAEGFHFINMVAIHEQKLNEGYNSFNTADCYYLISQLYATASSAKLYDIIKERQKKKNNR